MAHAGRTAMQLLTDQRRRYNPTRAGASGAAWSASNRRRPGGSGQAASTGLSPSRMFATTANLCAALTKSFPALLIIRVMLATQTSGRREAVAGGHIQLFLRKPHGFPGVGAHQVRAPQVRAPQVRVPQVRVPQVRVPQVSAHQGRAFQVGAPPGRALQVRAPPGSRPPDWRPPNSHPSSSRPVALCNTPAHRPTDLR